jgi:phage terminase small subunit
MARPPKTTQLHVVDGTFNVTRHRNRKAAPESEGAPVKPADLDEFGLECWQKLVEPALRMKIGREVDAVAAEELCRLYSFYRRSCEKASADPIAKEARCAVTGYFAAFEKVASRFGFTPADRLRLVAPKPEGSGDPAERHFRDTA